MAESIDRVGITDHKIDPEQLKAGDHIYIHETGGLTNKHGVVLSKDNESLDVAYYNKERADIIICPLDEFTNGKYVRLFVYGVSKTRKRLSRRGSTSTRQSLPSEEVVDNIPYFIEHPVKIPFEKYSNKSEAFARACTSRTKPQFSPTDDSNDRVGKLSHAIEREKLQPGDHIYAYRQGGLYSHHGIYVGQDEDGEDIVINFTGDPGTKVKETAKIRKSSLYNFLNESKLRLVAYNDSSQIKRRGSAHKKPSLPASQVVEKAEYYAAHPEQWDEYHFLLNNCEHFAIFCKTGQKPQNNSIGINDQASIFSSLATAFIQQKTGH